MGQSIEEKRAKARERYRQRYATDEAFRQKESLRSASRSVEYNQRAKERAKKNYNRERDTKRKREYVKKCRDTVNAYRREYYAKNRDHLREVIYSSRKDRNPAHGLNAAIHRLKRGDLSIREFVELYGDAIARINALVDSKKRGTGE